MTTIAGALKAGGKAKEWAHNRLDTVGASEIGQCLRRVWYLKNETPADDGHVEQRGAADRGDIIEQHYWAPRLRDGLPTGLELLWSGAEQKTIVAGFISATPDGLIVNTSAEPATIEGVGLMPGVSVLAECKSIDPRVPLTEAKPEHRFQVQMQMGLVRECTNHEPIAALLTYVNASFLDDVKVFVIPYDDAVFVAGRDRARRIMAAKQAPDLPAEGTIAGGKECDLCPWRRQCGAVNFARVPADELELVGETREKVEHLASVVVRAGKAVDDLEALHKQAQEDLKVALQQAGARKAKTDSWSVSWFGNSGAKQLDRKAMEADGIDLSKYEVAGRAFDQLRVTPLSSKAKAKQIKEKTT